MKNDPLSKRILVVEDEISISDSISFVLRSEGFEPTLVTTAQDATKAIENGSYVLGILDVGLPDMSGFELLREIRKVSSLPVIFLTARAEEVDRVVGLEMGADDYIVKPFSPRELIARVKAVLRRSQRASIASSGESPPPEVVGPFIIDDYRQQITYHGSLLDLTRYEYRILSVFLGSPERVFTREHLMARAWEEPDMSLERTVDSHIKSIRAKLRAINSKSDPIVTHRGTGYSLELGEPKA